MSYDAVTRCGDCGQRIATAGADCDRCDAVCANCRKALRLHYSFNYADGPFVGQSHLVCPTSVFYPKVPR
jgi:hypothetical protein